MRKEAKEVAHPPAPLDADIILSKIYGSSVHNDKNPYLHYKDSDKSTSVRYSKSPFPLPPSYMRMGYAENNDEEYYQSGIKSSNSMKKLIQAEGLSLAPGTKLMDWGCSTGRVLRHFAVEAEQGEFWGVDQDEPSLLWDKSNLSPPFHFLTCTAYPHMPFPDETFDIIYGLSVFTHIIHFYDIWLMEFRRILKKGGCAIFTVCDESTWTFFRTNWKPDWVLEEDMSRGLQHDVTIYGGGHWGMTYTFFRKSWIEQEWNRYLSVTAIEPMAEDYQTAVVLRKT